MTNQQTQKLKQIIQGDITQDAATLDAYRHDASIFDILPSTIVYPKATQDLEQLVKFVTANKAANPELSITARSAGTDMGGGSVNDSIIVDFTKYFNKFLELGRTYAVTQPGVFYRDFEKETLKHNLIMPSYPASRALCAMGGIAANNSGGEKSLSVGKTLKYVDEVWAVMSDGNEYHFGPLSEPELEQKLKLPNFEGQLYRDMYRLIKDNYDSIQKARPYVSKNSAGYYLWDVWDKKTFNLSKVLVGSQGTLGLFTKIKFKLIQPHAHSELLVMFLNDLAPLGKIVNTVMKYDPESFESFDDHTFSLAIRFLPSMLKRMKGNIIKLGFQFLPEMWMTLTGGLPKLILIAEFTGDDEIKIQERLHQAEEEIRRMYGIKTHITKNEAEAEKYWTVRRESFNLLRNHVKNMHTAPFVDDIAVRPEQLPEFLPELDAIFKKYPSLIYTIAGHAGDANFHIIPLMDFTKADQRAIIPKLSDEVYDLVLRYHGTITAEHNDGLVRGPYLEKMYGPKIFDLFKQTKHIFDPLNIFNPHKKTDATEAYLIDHIRTD